eukprot:1560714-Rhodomonas_salina.1
MCIRHTGRAVWTGDDAMYQICSRFGDHVLRAAHQVVSSHQLVHHSLLAWRCAVNSRAVQWGRGKDQIGGSTHSRWWLLVVG